MQETLQIELSVLCCSLAWKKNTVQDFLWIYDLIGSVGSFYDAQIWSLQKFSIWKRQSSFYNKFSHHSFQQRARKALGERYYLSKTAISPKTEHFTWWWQTYTYFQQLFCPYILRKATTSSHSPLHYLHNLILQEGDRANLGLWILKERRDTVSANI